MLDFDELINSRDASVSEIYRRNSLTVASFEDFTLMHVIGRGTFGKVYLVRCNKNDRLFAMKCIRKDVVIEHESVESLKVERLILTQVNHPFVIGMDYVF